jgi:hypothetical protein
MADWSTILETRQTTNVITDFANETISARETLRRLTNGAFTEFNKILKERRTQYTRRLARKALRRRGVSI